MAIIVEDGSIVDSANSYVDVAYADAYYELRGIEEWELLTASKKEQSLIIAIDFIEAIYSFNFKGLTKDASQSLSFPRTDAYVNDILLDDATVPTQIKRAQVEMALKASRGEPLIVDQDKAVIRERVEGAIDISYDRYSDPATKYSFVSKLISPLLISGSAGALRQVRLVRV